MTLEGLTYRHQWQKSTDTDCDPDMTGHAYLVAMSSHLHETLVEMFRDRPTLAPEILAGLLGLDIPEYEQVGVSSGELPDVLTAGYRADVVLTLSAGSAAVFAVIVEVQLRADPRKRQVWPVYVATVHARLRCPAMLLVVCPNRAAAA
jgi:hypothetical protein